MKAIPHLLTLRRGGVFLLTSVLHPGLLYTLLCCVEKGIPNSPSVVIKLHTATIATYAESVGVKNPKCIDQDRKVFAFIYYSSYFSFFRKSHRVKFLAVEAMWLLGYLPITAAVVGRHGQELASQQGE